MPVRGGLFSLPSCPFRCFAMLLTSSSTHLYEGQAFLLRLGSMNNRKTEKGFAIPIIEDMPQGVDGSGDGPPARPPRTIGSSPATHTSNGLSKDNQPILELEVHHHHGPAPDASSKGPMLCIWTVNHVYEVDAAMRCVRVVQRRDKQPKLDHPMLRARLIGGQRRHGDEFELTSPFPRPGTEAVFEDPVNGTRFARTSTVSRVVLHFYAVTVTPNRLMPTWSDLQKS